MVYSNTAITIKKVYNKCFIDKSGGWEGCINNGGVGNEL
jgi:hypothetical protein